MALVSRDALASRVAALSLGLATAASSAALAAPAARVAAPAARGGAPCIEGSACTRHVLLLSVDGMHAVDLARYVATHPQSALAALAATGTTYANAFTTGPSDSFPGMLALVTGGHPVTTGVYYDDSYDKSLFAPGTACKGAPGAEIVYDESIDANPAALDGGGAIDPAKLPLALTATGCVPVYPHSFLRVNTAFEAVRASGGYTAWSDKHLAYDLLNGPSGKGVDDLYDPEIASTDGTIAGTEAYDGLKVAAVVHEIDGRTHDGARKAPIPALFGMNFQSLSVAQKLAGAGYLDANATPSAGTASALDFVDASLRTMLRELDERGLRRSTTVIVTAKHGQSPIDPALRRIVSSKAIPALVTDAAQVTQDDVALLWLTDSSAATRAAAIAKLRTNAATLGVAEVYDGARPPLGFGFAPIDPRAPDVVDRSVPGVIYTKTTATKIAEHGGLSADDRHVALLVSAPEDRRARTIGAQVETVQVAPTILDLLRIAPRRLESVRYEGTQALPGILGR